MSILKRVKNLSGSEKVHQITAIPANPLVASLFIYTKPALGG
jgi:hypothetical protein